MIIAQCLSIQGLAAMATPSAKKVLAENLKQRAHKEKKIVDAASKTAEALKSLELKIAAKTGAGDKLFGSITNMDVAAALEKQGHEIDKKFISINGGTVKRTGSWLPLCRAVLPLRTSRWRGQKVGSFHRRSPHTQAAYRRRTVPEDGSGRARGSPDSPRGRHPIG